MMKFAAAILVLLLPCALFSQGDKKAEPKNKVRIMTSIPVQAQYSENFAIRKVEFNKLIDYFGKGEILEVQFSLENLTDDPMDLYIFTIASFEKVQKTKSSLERPIPLKHRIRNIVTFPDDIANFQYPMTDNDGKVIKDEHGADRLAIVKFPKNPRAGVDQYTGKPYHLTDKLVVRLRHLSRYRNNYIFFNELAILIFDSEGKPAFRQLYQLRGTRHR